MERLINKRLVSVSILHFLVDFISVGSLVLAFNYFKDSFAHFSYIFLIYNCLAFLLQPFFGLLIDHFDDERERKAIKAFMLLSIGILLLGYSSIQLFHFSGFRRANIVLVFVGAVLLGIGNALFHVTGGKEALIQSTKATPGGLFVSTGALGVGLASIMVVVPFAFDLVISFILIIPIITIIFTFVYLSTDNVPSIIVYEMRNVKKIKTLITIVVVLCLAIAVRSFLGFYTKVSENLSGWEYTLLFAVAAFFGKAIGGIILDLVGPYFLLGISTIISVMLSIFNSVPFFSFIFVLSFNMLMPLTLDVLRKCFPNKEGFAFGLAASFLIPGYLLGGALKKYGTQNIVVPIVCFLTGALLVVVYLLYNKVIKNERNN